MSESKARIRSRAKVILLRLFRNILRTDVMVQVTYNVRITSTSRKFIYNSICEEHRSWKCAVITFWFCFSVFRSYFYSFFCCCWRLFIIQEKSWQLFPEIKSKLCFLAIYFRVSLFLARSFRAVPFAFMFSKYTWIKNSAYVFFGFKIEIILNLNLMCWNISFEWYTCLRGEDMEK